MLVFGFLNTLWLSLATFFQLTVIDQLATSWPKPNLILVSLTIWLILRGWSRISYWILGLGIVLDCLSFYNFGSQTLVWLASLGLTNLLLVNFFTNKSLYAFSGLIISATIFQTIILAILGDGLSKINWLTDFFGQIAANWLLMIALYYLIRWLDNRLNPLFLSRNRQYGK
ncbi:MAG TPA: hypothetical protein PKN62_01645 [bacterium]|nr:hypothetical protein [bacterium]